jgi:predicted nuclease of predicted toxin-antitoxin system
MKILVDMNLSPRWIDFRASAGFEAAHWSQIGASDARDTEVMHWTADHDHIVLTSDLDFGAILAATHDRRPSVVQLRSDVLTTSVIGSVVVAALRQMTRELNDGALVSVDTTRTRLRVLPLRD